MANTERTFRACALVAALMASLSQCRSNESQPPPAAVRRAPGASAAPPPASARAPTAPPDRDTVAERLEAAGLKVEETREFLDTLKALGAKRDRQGLCALVSYPLKVHSMRANHTVGNEAACRNGFARIFTVPVLDAIAGQRLLDIAAGSNGAMIGDGAVWFSGVCSDEHCRKSEIRIISINN